MVSVSLFHHTPWYLRVKQHPSYFLRIFNFLVPPTSLFCSKFGSFKFIRLYNHGRPFLFWRQIDPTSILLSKLAANTSLLVLRANYQCSGVKHLFITLTIHTCEGYLYVLQRTSLICHFISFKIIIVMFIRELISWAQGLHLFQSTTYKSRDCAWWLSG